MHFEGDQTSARTIFSSPLPFETSCFLDLCFKPGYLRGLIRWIPPSVRVWNWAFFGLGSTSSAVSHGMRMKSNSSYFLKSTCRPFKWMPWPWCLEAYTTTWNLDSMHPHLLEQEPGSRLKAFKSNGSQISSLSFSTMREDSYLWTQNCFQRTYLTCQFHFHIPSSSSQSPSTSCWSCTSSPLSSSSSS